MVLQHLDQAGLVAGLLQDGFELQERVVVARQELQDLRGGERSRRQVAELVHLDGEHAAQEPNLLGLALCVLDLA